MTSGRLTQTQFAGCRSIRNPAASHPSVSPLGVEPMERKAAPGMPWNQDGINTSISPAIEAQSARGPHQDTALRKEILLHL